MTKKISELPAIASLDLADLIALVDDSAVQTKKGTIAQLDSFLRPRAHKTADQVVNNSIVLVDDNELVVNLLATTIYRIRGRLFTNLNNGGIRVALNGTATFTSLKAFIRIWEDDVVHAAGRVTAFDQVVQHGPPGAGNHYVEIDGVIQVNAAGTLLVRWAQDNAHASDSTVQIDSSLEVVRL